VDPLSLPEDIIILGDEEIAEILRGAIAAFGVKSNSTIVTPDRLDQLPSSLRQSMAFAPNRPSVEAAHATAVEADSLAAKVPGEEPEPKPAPEVREAAAETRIRASYAAHPSI